MTSFVLTLIGNKNLAPLESVHIELVCQRLAKKVETDWLAKNEACDIFLNSTLSARDITEQAREVLSGTAIDTVCTAINGRRKKLLISDMDSTIIDQECIDELGDAIGLGSQIRAITALVISGDMSFSEALRERMGMMKGIERSLLENVFEDRISLKVGARTLVQTMRHHGAFCILVSGGFSFFTRRIAEHVGFNDHQGNQLIFENGKVTGEVQEPILGRTAKLNTLMRLCSEKNIQPSDVLAVGDGANDIKMIKAAGLGVAFHGSKSLKNQANACIVHGDLTALLYIQGFHKSEFMHS
ncbi:MAG: phosphoserine phosphatase SerB [Rhodospirillales bacterium]|nr:phosphoserine phosphatase SerB [Rhodospirillales bacterium]